MRQKTFRFAIPATLVAALAFLGVLPACGKDEPAGERSAGTARSAPPKAEAPAGEAKGAPSSGGGSAVLAYQKGIELLKKGDFEAAQAQFEQAVQLDPKMSEAHYNLGQLLVQRSNQKIWKKARDMDMLNTGIAEITRACELEPTNDDYFFHLGRAYYLKDDYEHAKVHLQKALELNPKLPGAWKALGQAQLDSGETQQGRDSFQRALELAPDDPKGLFQLAQALESLGDLPGARANYEKSIALDPSVYEVHMRLGQVCGKLGDEPAATKAREDMQRWKDFDDRLGRRKALADKNPKSASALRSVGMVYYEAGDWENASDWFLRAIRVDTRDWRAHLYRGVARRHLKDFEWATKHLKEAEFDQPDVLDPKLELLRLYADLKDETSLVALLTKTEGEAAEDGNSLYYLGEVCRELGRQDDATRLFAKAAAHGVTEAPANPAVVEEEGEEE